MLEAENVDYLLEKFDGEEKQNLEGIVLEGLYLGWNRDGNKLMG